MVHEVQKQSDSDLIMIQYHVEALGRSSTNFFASSGDVNEGDFPLWEIVNFAGKRSDHLTPAACKALVIGAKARLCAVTSGV